MRHNNSLEPRVSECSASIGTLVVHYCITGVCVCSGSVLCRVLRRVLIGGLRYTCSVLILMCLLRLRLRCEALLCCPSPLLLLAPACPMPWWDVYQLISTTCTCESLCFRISCFSYDLCLYCVCSAVWCMCLCTVYVCILTTYVYNLGTYV